MKKLWVSAIVVLAAVSLVGCIHAPPGTDGPFHVDGSGTLEIGFSGTLTGTVAGTFFDTGSIDGSYEFGPGHTEACPSDAATVTASVTLTAANGDTLNQSWSGSLCGPGRVNTLHATLTYTNEGGTGRFSQATGTGTAIVDTDSNPSPSVFTLTMDGTMCCFGKR